MAWGSKTNASQLTSITTEQYFTTTPTLNPQELLHCEVEIDFPTTPTDHAVVSVYPTLDATAENWDDTPFMQFQISNTIDPNKVGFTVVGIYKFRIGIKRTGTTDTLTSANFSYRANGVAA